MRICTLSVYVVETKGIRNTAEFGMDFFRLHGIPSTYQCGVGVACAKDLNLFKFVFVPRL